MTFAGTSVATVAIGSTRINETGTADAWPGRPLLVEVNGVSWLDFAKTDALRITDTLGSMVTARLVFMNPDTAPVAGDQVRVIWYDLVIFAGTIVRVQKTVNNTQTARRYECDVNDYTQILTRRKLTQNFANLGIAGIVDYILDNDLSEEGLSLGQLDSGTALPLVSADSAPVVDVLREAAAGTGQAMYVGYDKTLNFVSTNNPSMTVNLTVDNVEDATLTEDLEVYRNRQYVKVKGTPLSESTTDAVEVTESKENADQIAARQAIEGGSGVYEEWQSLTHPTSNATADLQLLGQAYARINLSISGTPRSTLKARVRHYGFRAGQVGTCTLPSLGVSGEWLIQRVTITEQAGRKLVHDLELVQSSLQWRAYQAWLTITRTGKVVILPPTALTNTVETFSTPGSTTWTVPAGVTTAQFTCIGGSGAGGGGSRDTSVFYPYRSSANGASGGNSGFAVTTISVTPGQVYTVVVGSGGTPGGTAANSGGYGGTGPSGTLSSVSLSAVVYCQGDPGTGGTGGFTAGSRTHYDGSPGTPGSGLGDAFTTGGGKIGGAGGTATTALANDGSIGQDGRVEIAY